MATTYYNDIQKLYVAYFNRPADPKGLAFWETAVEAAKGSTAAVAAAFAKSAEYTAAFNGKSNAEIVDQVYKNLFGRGATDDGAKFWIDGLNNKVITVADVVTAVAAGAQGTDATAFNNKVKASAAFTAALDTDAEIAGYTGDAANAIAKTWLSGITTDVSYADATSPAKLSAGVAAAVAAGTPFSITSALAQVNAATKALNDFVKATATTDVNSDGKKDAADITAAKTAAVTKVAGDLTGGAAGTSGTLFSSTDSQTVRDALITAQQTANAKALADAQAKVVTDNANIAKIAGLTDAVSSLTATQSVLKSAQTADTAAQADLAAKLAAFNVNNGGTPGVTGSNLTVTVGGTTTTLATIDADGKATVSTATGFDATKWAGLSDLIASFNADVTTSVNVTKAAANVANAQLAANLLDVAPAVDAGGAAINTTVDGTTYTEAQLIKAIADTINGTTPNTVATGGTPTVAQIQTELAVLKAATDQTAYNAFKALVDAETGLGGTTALDAKWNPLVGQQAADTKLVSDIGTAISTLAKDVTALQTANANADTLSGLNAAVTAYNKVLVDKGYAVTTLDAAHTANFATAASDIYVVSSAQPTASIAAFGLQGTDSLFVGAGYTMVKGAIGATGVKGSDSALEIFVSNNNGDAVLQIENHAYSSAVTGGTGEIVTITLTGVDASLIKLDANGIITVGTAA